MKTFETQAADFRDRALKNNFAWDIVEELTTELGPRLAGSAAEARAREWSVKKMKALGFVNVRIEPFEVPGWERGRESVEVIAPGPQPLTVAALGYSGATSAEGVEGKVVQFNDMAALKAASESDIKDKIVYISHGMKRDKRGMEYFHASEVRRSGPSIAATKGAAAVLIRSLGTDYHRNPHTGAIQWEEGQEPIAAGALSLPDADQLERLIARGPVKLKVTLTPKTLGPCPCGNVIGEIVGSEYPDEIVLVGGHIDSWDLATGAIDDGAGCAITAAAAKLILDSGHIPKRTIRVVFFGAEEIGLFGGAEYARVHKSDHHVLAAESDLGADRVFQLDSVVDPADEATVSLLCKLLEPLGVAEGTDMKFPGPDIGALAKLGVPTVTPWQDATKYFDLHHTPDDTLDKIELEALNQNVAVYATILWVAANVDPGFKMMPVKDETDREKVKEGK